MSDENASVESGKERDGGRASLRMGQASFAAGCFWCVEAVFAQLDGVCELRSGYMGGTSESPSYEDVCSGKTGHAEVVSFRYDPQKVSYEKLLEWFFKLHDPTTLNRQGGDVGTQYRSAIFYHEEEQRGAAENMIASLTKAGAFEDPIVTQIVEVGRFYQAEAYHQDYYRQNKEQAYCRFNILPKLDKLGLDQ